MGADKTRDNRACLSRAVRLPALLSRRAGCRQKGARAQKAVCQGWGRCSRATRVRLGAKSGGGVKARDGISCNCVSAAAVCRR